MAAVRSLLAASAVALLAAFAAPAGAAVQGWTPPAATLAGLLPSGVAMTDDGTAVVAGRQVVEGSGYEPVVRVRPPGGTFGAVQVLAPASAAAIRPAIAAVPGGGVALAWKQGDQIVTGRIAPGATQVSHVVVVPEAAAPAQDDVVIAADGAGTIHLLWTEESALDSQQQSTTYLATGQAPISGTPSSAVLDSGSDDPAHGTNYNGLQLKVSSGGTAIAGWLKTAFTDTGSGTSDELYAQDAVHAAGLAFTGVATLASGEVNDGMGQQTNVGVPVVGLRGSTAAAVWDTHTSTSGGGASSSDYELKAGLVTTLGGSTLWRATALSFTSAVGPGAGPLALTLPASGGALIGWAADIGARRSVQVVSWDRGRGAGTLGDTQTITPSRPADAFTFVDGGDPAQVAIHGGDADGETLDVARLRDDGSWAPAETEVADGNLFAGAPLTHEGPAGGLAAWASDDGAGTIVAGLDETPPVVRATFPAGGLAGAPLGFAASATDVWGPVTFHWDFGDGAGAGGASVAHAFGAAGAPTATVTASDAAGNSAQAAQALSITAPPRSGGGGGGAGGGVGGAGVKDVTAPRLSGLSINHTKFLPVVPGKATKKSRTPRGATFGMTLSEVATVTITIGRATSGLRHGRSCVAPTAKLRRRHARSCTRYLNAGKLSGKLLAGKPKLAFSGRLDGKALRAGRYATSAVATDAAGNRGAVVAGPRFTIA